MASQGWNVDVPVAEYYGPIPWGWENRVIAGHLEPLIKEIEDTKRVALDTETTGLVNWKDIPLYFSLAWGRRRATLHASLLPYFNKAFGDPYKEWVFANAKYDAHILANVGSYLAGSFIDTQVQHSLLYDDHPHDLKYMAQQKLGWRWSDFQDTFGKITKNFPPAELMKKAERDNFPLLIEYAANDAWGTLNVDEALTEELKSAYTYSLFYKCYPYIETLWDLFVKTEVPYTKVLWKNERNGFLINKQQLDNLKPIAESEIKKLEQAIAQERGKLINPNSTPQLRQWLVEECGLKPLKMSKGGKDGTRNPSVDSAFLDYHAEEGHRGCQLVREYRSIDKLYGMYIVGLAKVLDPYDRVHTSLQQSVARCLPAGELVLTSRGYLPVEQVKVDDLVISHTGLPRKVIETSKHKPRRIYKIVLDNGLELRTTSNHKYKTLKSWVRADKLVTGTTVVVHSEKEHWKTIPGWHDFQVSSWGRVFNKKTGYLLTAYKKGKWGHLKVHLYRNGSQKRGPDRKDFPIHRLVIEAFKPKRVKPGYKEVRHLNGIAWDNTLRNLTYGTRIENCKDSIKHGTTRNGRRLSRDDVANIRKYKSSSHRPSPNSKLSFEKAQEIRELYKRLSLSQIAEKFKVSVSAVWPIVKNKAWTRPLAKESTADKLAKQYGVSAATIRDVWAGRRWADREESPPRANFYEAKVVKVMVEEPEITYGLTVEIDHSHVTGGIVTHNTGRLSSSNPNLQNIAGPEKDKFGIRRAFVAPPGHKLIVADYQQLEMRLLAAAAGEKDMIDIFLKGWDIHMGNASMMFGIPYDELKEAKSIEKKVKQGELLEEMLTSRVLECLHSRSAAKNIGFGLNYGMGPDRLARTLGITRSEAEAKVSLYMQTYPAVAHFYKEAIEETERTGYAFTILGRRRSVAEIASARRAERSRAERIAVNLQIQGCLPASTKILTKEGYIAIGKAPDRGVVWTGTGWEKYDKLDRGEAELAELILGNGQTLACDVRHSILVNDGTHYIFKHFDELKAGDLVCTSLARPVEYGVQHAHPSHYYWMGFACGNAWSSSGPSHRNAITFTFGDRKGRYSKEERATQFSEYIKRAFAIEHQKPDAYPNKVSITVENAGVRRFFESLGYCWGSIAKDKRIPATVWTSNLENRLAFILGFLDADGNLHQHTPNIHLCQREILEEVQLIARTCGIESSLRGPYEDSWRLDLVGSHCAKYLGYGSARRCQVSMPAPSSICLDMKEKKVGTTDSHRTIRSRASKGVPVSVYTVADMYAASGLNLPELYACRELVEKKQLGVMETTYTLSVHSPLHRFDSEGVISKNSAADVVKCAQVTLDMCGLDQRYECHSQLQVHDELIHQVPEEYVEVCKEIIIDHMEHPFFKDLLVPLEVDVGVGNNWLEAK